VQTPSDKQDQSESHGSSGKIEIVVNGVRPLVVNKRTMITAFGGSTKLVDQLLHVSTKTPDAGWLKVVRPGSPGVEVLVDRASVEQSYSRILRGEFPPLLPSQVPSQKLSRRQCATAGTMAGSEAGNGAAE
jgi:hypothetical protein